MGRGSERLLAGGESLTRCPTREHAANTLEGLEKGLEAGGIAEKNSKEDESGKGDQTSRSVK